MLPKDEPRPHPTHARRRHQGGPHVRRNREALDAEDDPLPHALVHLISIVGEAASRVGSDTRAEFYRIPWADIVGMRNRLIHAYFDINLDILWLRFKRACLP